MKEVIKIIVQANHDTRACYRVAKEIEKMIKGKGLQVFQERMKTMTHDLQILKKIHREQTDEIKAKEMYNILQEGVTIKMRIIANTILGDEYLYIFPMRTRRIRPSHKMRTKKEKDACVAVK